MLIHLLLLHSILFFILLTVCHLSYSCVCYYSAGHVTDTLFILVGGGGGGGVSCYMYFTVHFTVRGVLSGGWGVGGVPVFWSAYCLVIMDSTSTYTLNNFLRIQILTLFCN
jgi:hypothetical protein